jgi:O-antigen/teichoic acid export membrane protein
MIKKSEHFKYLLFSYFVTFSNIVTGLVLIPLIMRHEGVEALGVFGLLFSTKAVVDIGLGWLSSSMTRSLLKTKFNFNNISTISFIVNGIYGCLASLLVMAYGWHFKNEYFDTYIAFSIYILVSFITIPCYEILNARLMQYKVAFFRFLQQFLFMLLSIGIYLYTHELKWVFISLLLSSFITFLFVSMKLYSDRLYEVSFTKHYRKILSRVFLKQGRKYLVNGVSTILLLQIDVLVLEYYFGSEVVGAYLVLWRIPNTIIMLGWRVSEPLQHSFGKAYSNNEKLSESSFNKYERIVLLCALLGGAGYALTGGLVLDLWLGEGQYEVYDNMFLVSSLVIAMSIIQRFYSNACYYTQGLSKVTLLQFIELFFKVAFISLLFSQLSVMSSIYGWALAMLFTLPFYRINARKILA